MSPGAWLTDPLVLARFVHYAGCVLAAGTAAFAVLTAAPPQPAAAVLARLQRRWRTIVSLGAALAALSGAAWLALVAADIVGASLRETVLDGGLWSVMSGTQFGRFAAARLVLALVLVVPRGPPPLRLAVAMALLVLLAPAGHAGAQPGLAGDIHLAVDALHLAAAGAWLGGLPALALLLAAATGAGPALRDVAVRTTARFSRLGIVCVGVLIASGIVNGWFLLSGVGDLVDTAYGQVLALKIGLFAGMLGLAAVNRLFLLPRLARGRAAGHLLRNSVVELCLGVGVLFLVAVLGTLEPGGHAHRHTELPSSVAVVHIHTNVVMADVTIDPDRAGPVKLDVHLANEDFTHYAARALHVALRPPQSDGATIARDAAEVAPGHWRIDRITLPRSGIWTINLTVAPQQGAIVMLDGPIVIAP